MAVEATRKMSEHRTIATHRQQRHVGMIRQQLRLERMLISYYTRGGKSETGALFTPRRSHAGQWVTLTRSEEEEIFAPWKHLRI